jgi:hypothetical protein
MTQTMNAHVNKWIIIKKHCLKFLPRGDSKMAARGRKQKASLLS